MDMMGLYPRELVAVPEVVVFYLSFMGKVLSSLDFFRILTFPSSFLVCPFPPILSSFQEKFS